MTRRGLMGAAALACALAVPVPAGAATSLPVGSTQTTMALCPGGPPGTSNPGSSAPSGCQGGSGATATLCKDADVHAFVQTQRMMDGKRPALAPLGGTVLIRLESGDFGTSQNADTFADTGTALAQIGAVPPGTYSASASLRSGETMNADGTMATYPASTTSMTLVVTDSPCGTDGGSTPTTTKSPGAKAGCGVGDKNHVHDPGDGKTCPTK
jgi:hypothetical protein